MPRFVYSPSKSVLEHLGDTYRFRGVAFPLGQAVQIDDVLAAKLRCLECFYEVGDEYEAQLVAAVSGQGVHDASPAVLNGAAATNPPDDAPTGAAPRKRGRPPGSKNKPKVTDGH